MAKKKASPPRTENTDIKKSAPAEKKSGSKTNKIEPDSSINEETKPAAKKAAVKKSAKKAAISTAGEAEPETLLPAPEAVELLPPANESAEAKPVKKAAQRKPPAKKKAIAEEEKVQEPITFTDNATEVIEHIEPVTVAEEKNEELVHKLADVGKHNIEEKTESAESKPAQEDLTVTAEQEPEPVQETSSSIAEPEPVAEESIELAKETSQSSPAAEKNITFIVNYYTKPGQTLFITSHHPLFGNGNPDAALPMEFLDAEHWKAEVSLNDITEDISYNYLLKEEDGSLVYDGGKDKKITPSSYNKNEVTLLDSWDFAGYYDNAFFTEPFKNVLLKNNFTSTETPDLSTYTHQLKVKAPLLLQGQVICLTGSTDALKNWDTNEPFLLNKKDGENDWYIKLDLNGAGFPLYYKYGIYDINKKQFVQLENGDNRVLNDISVINNEAIVNDGFIRTTDITWKGAGVALPVFSLRTEDGFGCGEFSDIKKLVDWSKTVGLKLIQLLPVNDTTSTKTWRDSYPYASISAFALHAMYLNADAMTNEANKHLLDPYIAEAKRLNSLPAVDYEAVNDIKWKIIHDIYPLQKEATFTSEDYKVFFADNKHWLEPFAAFCHLRDKCNTADFTKWNEYKKYSADILSKLFQSEEDKNAEGMYYFVQYHLHLQLKEAAEYAHNNGIIIKGDIAIGVARNSADAWQHPELFNMDMQAGAPPDAFATKGQNWSFPTYNWQHMKEDGFAWWKQRFSQMSNYFDAFRIDHILGFFRIWSIPTESVEGIMGHFVPALPVHVNEFDQWNTYFDYKRYTKPFINDKILNDLFGDQQGYVRDTFLHADEDGTYSLKPEVSTQKRVDTYFAIREPNEHNNWVKQSLFDLISNVILFEEQGSNGQLFHFRFGMEKTLSYQYLDDYTKKQLYYLSLNYFYERQNEFWRNEAMQKLPALKQETDMLICGEDLGLVPVTVPRVMQDLGLLSLEVQRMPKDEKATFTNLEAAPYLSVVTPSTHDMSIIRGWWEEDRNLTQKFYNNQLGHGGEAPLYCEPWINKQVVEQHLYSPAMWSIFQLQDIMGIDGELRRANPNDERINVPAIPNYYWNYRVHLTLEDLMNKTNFTSEVKEMIVASGR